MSKAILLALSTHGRGFTLSGVPWLNGQTLETGANSLRAKVLCTRHNNALSPLDAVAAIVVDHLRADQTQLARLYDPSSGADPRPAFTMVSGPLWERWMLKSLIGAMEAGAFGAGSERIDAWAPDVDIPTFIEVLFYGESFPEGTGMSIGKDNPGAMSSANEVALTPFSSISQGGLIGVTLTIGVLEMSLSLVPLRDVLRRRVGLIRFTRTSPDTEKLLAFAWATPNGDIVDMRMSPGNSPSSGT